MPDLPAIEGIDGFAGITMHTAQWDHTRDLSGRRVAIIGTGASAVKRHRQIFWQDSCRLANSCYFDENGDVPLRPTSTPEAMWRSRRFPLADYDFSA